jgi:beta-glucosidase
VTVHPNVFQPEHVNVATAKIKNTGSVAGAQILQLYISAPSSPTPRPVKELHGFEKVFLEPGQEETVRITIDKYATSFWDEIENMWKSEEGIYEVLIGTSSQEILGKGELAVTQSRYWLGL